MRSEDLPVMGSCAWLRLLLLSLAALQGLTTNETQLGILGKSSLLRIPDKFLQLARNSSSVFWKKSQKESKNKNFLVKVFGGNLEELHPGRLRFHQSNFSLEILETSRADAGLYEFSVIMGTEEKNFHIQLRVLEAVADVSILVLAREWSGGRCSLALRCSAARGDEVSYSWGGDPGPGPDPGDDPGPDPGSGADPDPPCSGTGPSLNLSFSGRERSLGCACTARNAVSDGSAALEPAGCGTGGHGGAGLRTELVALLVAIAVGAVVAVAIVVARRAARSAGGERDPTQESGGSTVYAQVQRGQATLESSASPKPRGPPQEPTTVYASVTLPVL